MIYLQLFFTDTVSIKPLDNMGYFPYNNREGE